MKHDATVFSIESPRGRLTFYAIAGEFCRWLELAEPVTEADVIAAAMDGQLKDFRIDGKPSKYAVIEVLGAVREGAIPAVDRQRYGD